MHLWRSPALAGFPPSLKGNKATARMWGGGGLRPAPAFGLKAPLAMPIDRTCEIKQRLSRAGAADGRQMGGRWVADGRQMDGTQAVPGRRSDSRRRALWARERQMGGRWVASVRRVRGARSGRPTSAMLTLARCADFQGPTHVWQECCCPRRHCDRMWGRVSLAPQPVCCWAKSLRPKPGIPLGKARFPRRNAGFSPNTPSVLGKSPLLQT